MISPLIVSGYTTLTVVALLLLIVASVPAAYASTSTGRSAYIGVMIPVTFCLYVAAAYFVIQRPLIAITKAAGHSSSAPVDVVLASLRSSGCIVPSTPLTPGSGGMRIGSVCTKELTKLVYSLPTVYREVAALRRHCVKLGLVNDEAHDPFELHSSHRQKAQRQEAARGTSPGRISVVDQKVREWNTETPATAPAGSKSRRYRSTSGTTAVTDRREPAMENRPGDVIVDPSADRAEQRPRRKKRILVRRMRSEVQAGAAAGDGSSRRVDGPAGSSLVRSAAFLDPIN